MTTRAEFQRILTEITQSFGTKTPREINCGSCGDWAQQVKNAVPEVEIYEFDEDVTGMEPEHIFVKFEGKYYDAQAPRGVKDWRDLPLFRFYRRRYDSDYSGVEPILRESVRDTSYAMHNMAEEKNWPLDPTKGVYMWRRFDS